MSKIFELEVESLTFYFDIIFIIIITVISERFLTQKMEYEIPTVHFCNPNKYKKKKQNGK